MSGAGTSQNSYLPRVAAGYRRKAEPDQPPPKRSYTFTPQWEVHNQVAQSQTTTGVSANCMRLRAWALNQPRLVFRVLSGAN